jgi:mono/diheme cytochrome c family protein
VGGHALSFNTREMNQGASMNGFTGNQLTLLSQAGYLDAPVSAPQTLPAFATATDATRSLESRVRSYLAVNCIQCHQPGGSGASTWNARPEITLAQTGLINGEPDNNGANPLNKLVVPGDTTHSVLLQRILGNGFTRMPPLATHELDQGAINLLTAWISSELTNYQTFAQWQIANFGSTNNPSAAANADPDSDSANNYYEFLTRTSPLTNAPPPWTITIDEAAATVGVNFLRLANLGFLVETSTDFTNWSAWDVPGNQPFFSVSNVWTTVSGPRSPTDTNQFFRVRIFEP